MYKYLFEDIIYKELDFLDLSFYKNKIDLAQLEKDFPIVQGQKILAANRAQQRPTFVPSWVDFPNCGKPAMLTLANFDKVDPEICKYVVGTINEHLKIDLLTRYVLLVKTVSTSIRHVDNDYRNGAINCFINNGHLAVTEFYDSIEGSAKKIAELHAQDGKSYLLNGAISHQVVQPDNSGTRLFLSVSIPLNHLA